MDRLYKLQGRSLPRSATASVNATSTLAVASAQQGAPSLSTSASAVTTVTAPSTATYPASSALLRVKGLLNTDLAMTTILETDYEVLASMARAGHFPAGFDGWYQLRAETVSTDGKTLPPLWIKPRHTFFGTLHEAYKFVDVNYNTRAITCIEQTDASTGQECRVLIDAVTGEQLKTLPKPLQGEPSFGAFQSALRQYVIAGETLLSTLTQQDQVFLRLRGAGFACRPRGQLDFGASFLIHLLGIDKFNSPTLFWPQTRYRVLKAALCVGHGRPLTKSYQLFIDAVKERAQAHEQGGVLSAVKEQKKCFRDIWDSKSTITILTRAQRDKLGTMCSKHARFEIQKAARGKGELETLRACKIFSILADSGGYMRYEGVSTSVPAFQTPEYDLNGINTLRIQDGKEFEKMLGMLRRENGPSVVLHGLEKLGLLNAVEMLRLDKETLFGGDEPMDVGEA